MEWKGRRGSRNIEDRRASGRRVSAGGAGVGGLGLVAVLVIGYFLGIDVTPLLNDPGLAGGSSQPVEVTAADQERAEFVSVTLADTEEVWAAVFKAQTRVAYKPPVLVLFKGATDDSPCGGVSAASGPFYCPGDRKVYLDTDFFVTLQQRLGAKGQFAAAYVVAHEVAHHVQNELGILGQANDLRAQASETDANEISVRIELQADCIAGIWAREAQDMGAFTTRDFEDAINAARQIGDDTLQASAGRVVNPESFTHGTAAQRARWFQKGLASGMLADCDTFKATRL